MRQRFAFLEFILLFRQDTASPIVYESDPDRKGFGHWEGSNGGKVFCELMMLVSAQQ